MTRIPDADQMDRRVPTNQRRAVQIDPNAATAPSRATADFGQELVRAGDRFQQVIKQNEAEDEKFALAEADNTFLRGRLELERGIQQGDSHYSTWNDSYTEGVNKIQEEIAATLSPEAQKEFDVRSTRSAIMGADRLTNKAHSQKLDEGRGRLRVGMQTDLELAVVTENASDRTQVLNNLNQKIQTAVDAGYISEEEAFNYRKSTGEEYAKRRISMMQPHSAAIVLNPQKYGGGIAPDAYVAMNSLEQRWGTPLEIISAHRDHEHNERVGGAKGSKHLGGKAFDVSTRGMDRSQIELLIRMARHSGFRGVGVYENSLHFDTGATRDWGPDYSSSSTPEWAKNALSVQPVDIDAPNRVDMELTKFLPVDQVHSMLNNVENRLRIDAERRESEFTISFGDYVDAVRAGAEVSPVVHSSFSEDLIAMSVNDPVKRKVMNEMRDDAVIYQDFVSDLNSMPVDQIAEKSTELLPSNVNDMADASLAPDRARTLSNWQNAVSDVLKRRNNDPSRYVSSTASPEFAESLAGSFDNNPSFFAQSMLSEQDRLGIPAGNQRILSNDMVSSIVQGLMEQDVDQSVQSLNELHKNWGAYGDRVLSELRKNGDLPLEMSVALRFADDPRLTAEIMSTAQLDLTELESNIPSGDLTDIREEFESELDDYSIAFESGDMSGAANRLFTENAEVAYKLALKYRRSGRNSSKAVNDVLAKMFPEQPVVENGVRVLIPPQFNRRDETYMMQQAKKSDALKSIDLVALDDPALPEFADEEVLRNSLSSNGVWVNNETGDGAILMIDIDGFYLPAEMRVDTPNGEKIQYIERKFGDSTRSLIERGLSIFHEGFD